MVETLLLFKNIYILIQNHTVLTNECQIALIRKEKTEIALFHATVSISHISVFACSNFSNYYNVTEIVIHHSPQLQIRCMHCH